MSRHRLQTTDIQTCMINFCCRWFSFFRCSICWQNSFSLADVSFCSCWISLSSSLHCQPCTYCYCTATFTNITANITVTYTHTHTHTFNGPFSGTTQASRYQKGKTNLDFTDARDSEWQWHQLGHMQVSTSLQTDNHASTPPLSFLQAGCPFCRPTNSVKALKAQT